MQMQQIQQASILSKVEATHKLLLLPTVHQVEKESMAGTIATQESTSVETETDITTGRYSKQRNSPLQPSWAYRLSPWWLNRAFEIQRAHSWQGWSFSLRSYRILSRDTLESAGECSAAELIQLFQDKKLYL